jgi:NADH:ubiquinone oxidoreductase subunit 2 (subunit N)
VATLAIVLSVIGSFYYLRLIKWIFFKDSNDFQYKLLSDIAQGFTTDKNVSNVSTNFPISLINSLILGSTLFILLTFILFPNILINVVFTSFTTTLF